MPAHFARFASDAQSPGVILLREAIPISNAIEELALIGTPAKLTNGSTESCVSRFRNNPPNCHAQMCFWYVIRVLGIAAWLRTRRWHVLVVPGAPLKTPQNSGLQIPPISRFCRDRTRRVRIDSIPPWRRGAWPRST
jgi:hypothetical protein